MPEKRSKNAKKAHFSAKVTLWYFQKYLKYGSNVFWGSKHIPWSHSEAISRPTIHSTDTTPTPLVNNCLFWRFLSYRYFYLQLGLVQNLGTLWHYFWLPPDKSETLHEKTSVLSFIESYKISHFEKHDSISLYQKFRKQQKFRTQQKRLYKPLFKFSTKHQKSTVKCFQLTLRLDSKKTKNAAYLVETSSELFDPNPQCKHEIWTTLLGFCLFST